MSMYLTNEGVERDDRLGRAFDNEADTLAAKINNMFHLGLNDTEFRSLKRMINRSFAHVKAMD